MATPLATDQRGAGYARFAGGVVDIGAFQVQTNVVTAAAPTSVYVDGSYAGDPLWTPITLAGGTVIVIGYDAFGTIQAGIDAVAAGGTVNIAAGTYTEQLTISQSVTLAGAGSSSTILQAPSDLSGNEIEIENGAQCHDLRLDRGQRHQLDSHRRQRQHSRRRTVSSSPAIWSACRSRTAAPPR